ncbi:MAG: TatD family hydrolase [Bacteroidetes bacterium]|nr:TatD family hydrolase [Bacteroidota bacterium]
MFFFDFHHHHRQNTFGIYNLNPKETPTENSFSVGIHPKNIGNNWLDNFQEIKTLAQNKHCVAIGECGLDKLVGVDFSLQKKVFLEHIQLANQIGKPLVIHCVRAYSEVVALCKKSTYAVVIHAFNKNQSVAQELLRHGFYLSFGKALLHNVSLHHVVKETPLDKMVLETDAATIDLQMIYEKVADLKSISLDELQRQINKNIETILNK